MTTATVPEAQQETDRPPERRAALRVSFVGAGTMAEAIIRGLLQRKVVAPGDVVASAPRAERRAYLADTYGLRAVAQNAAAAVPPGEVTAFLRAAGWRALSWARRAAPSTVWVTSSSAI